MEYSDTMKIRAIGVEQELVWNIEWADVVCLLSLDCLYEMRRFMGLEEPHLNSVSSVFVELVRRFEGDLRASEGSRRISEAALRSLAERCGDEYAAQFGAWFTTIYQWDRRWAPYSGAVHKWVGAHRSQGSHLSDAERQVMDLFGQMKVLDREAASIVERKAGLELSHWDRFVYTLRGWPMIGVARTFETDDPFDAVSGCVDSNLFQLFWVRLAAANTRLVEKFEQDVAESFGWTPATSLRRECRWTVPWPDETGTPT